MVGDSIQTMKCSDHIHEGDEWFFSGLFLMILYLCILMTFFFIVGHGMIMCVMLRKCLMFCKKKNCMSKCEFGKTSLVYLGHIVGGR